MIRRNRNVQVLLHVLAGSLVILAAIFGDYILGNPPDWGPLQSVGVAVGLLIILTGVLFSSARIIRISTNLCIAITSLFVCIALAEGFSRLLQYDFEQQEKAWNAVPIYYRKPIVPTGSVFFRRAGPQQWVGPVISRELERRSIEPNPYKNEAAIIVNYDSAGFRNPDDLKDWDIAVMGDATTELGYLPDQQLFTTIMGRLLRKRVKNLGVSYTASFTHLSYLRDYGVSPSTRHAVLVFFEGNDLKDLDEEYNALLQWRESGKRGYRQFKKQTSLVKAISSLLRRLREPSKEKGHANAYFKSPRGDVLITLKYTPPSSRQISSETMDILNYFLGEYATFAREKGITPWLAYMPCKLRVLHGHIGSLAHTPEPIRNWEPSDLPRLILQVSQRHAVRFIDLTPALIEETKKTGTLLYNSIYDTHLNSHGSLVAGKTTASHLTRFNARASN
jgi:hypothetical protein